jgi:hypothetical protein
MQSNASHNESPLHNDESAMARHKRRLMDRWRCKVPNHAYCFEEDGSEHVQLTEEDLETWANVIVRIIDIVAQFRIIRQPLANALARWLRDPPSSTREHCLIDHVV